MTAVASAAPCGDIPSMPEPTDDQRLIRRALQAWPGSAREFAEDIMVRDERTIQRWVAGDVAIPEVAKRRLRRFLDDAAANRARWRAP